MSWIIGWTASEAEGWVREVVTYLASGEPSRLFQQGYARVEGRRLLPQPRRLGCFLSNRAVEAHRWS